jgi:hypothetical protein
VKTTTDNLAALIGSSQGDYWYQIQAPQQGNGIDLGDPTKAWTASITSPQPVDRRSSEIASALTEAGIPAQNLDNAVRWVEEFLKKQPESEKVPRFVVGDQVGEGDRYLFAVGGAKGVVPIAPLSDLSKPPEVSASPDNSKRLNETNQERGLSR